MKSAAMAVVVASVVGCGTVRMGKKWDPEVVRTFKEGETTRAEVLKKLGEPWMRHQVQDGEMWMYMHIESKVQTSPASFIIPGYMDMQMDQKSQSVSLTFKGDVLGKIDWTGMGAVTGAPSGSTPATATATAEPPKKDDSDWPTAGTNPRGTR